MSFPEIYLEPINRAAAMLFARKDASEEQASDFAADLRSQLKTIDEAISSINGQLETRSDEPWRSAARRALRGYLEQKKSVGLLLKTARALLETIKQDNAQKHALEKRRIAGANVERFAAFTEARRKEKQRERLARIAAASDDTNRFNVAFRKIVRREFGDDEFERLMKQTKDHLIGLES